MLPKLLDPKELAEQLDETYEDVLRWARLGDIPCIRDGNRIYFSLSQVIKALRSKARAPEMEGSAA